MGTANFSPVADAAHSFLEKNPKVAIACGRLQEQNPEKSIYNRLADTEWDTPIGQAKASGGIMLARSDAFLKTSGFALISLQVKNLNFACVCARQGGKFGVLMPKWPCMILP